MSDHEPGCAVRELEDRMNALGPEGCRRHRAELLAQLEEIYGPRDDFESLLDESIRRAEAKAAKVTA